MTGAPASKDLTVVAVEYWSPWAVKEGVDPVDISDLDAAGGDVLYLASPLYGVARVQVAAEAEQSTTDYPAGAPALAAAIRVDPLDRVWVGAPGEGLIAVDARTDPPTIWAAGPAGLLKVIGLPGQK